MTKTFGIEAPHGRRSRLPFASFEEAVAKVVQGYEIIAEYDGSTSKPGEYADSAPVYSGGVLVAEISRSDLKNPLSPYVRTPIRTARPAYLDDELRGWIQNEINTGGIKLRKGART